MFKVVAFALVFLVSLALSTEADQEKKSFSQWRLSCSRLCLACNSYFLKRSDDNYGMADDDDYTSQYSSFLTQKRGVFFGCMRCRSYCGL
ncbi:unnamed protein product [Clavelina lepadiformis]|uniref:Uncharacterized protein n=1 Tax=Clavelina lepadiformis TaxID=159417 RepID=A0ABP0GS24_CLALP